MPHPLETALSDLIKEPNQLEIVQKTAETIANLSSKSDGPSLFNVNDKKQNFILQALLNNKLQYALLLFNMLNKKDPKRLAQVIWEPDASGLISLHFAAKLGSVDLMENILQTYVHSPLHAQTNRREALNFVDNGGFNTLNYASLYNRKEAVAYLIQEDISLDNPDNLGNTSLHIACQKGYLDIVNLLLAAGANYNLKNDLQKTALQLTIAEGNQDPVRRELFGNIILALNRYGALIGEDIQLDFGFKVKRNQLFCLDSKENLLFVFAENELKFVLKQCEYVLKNKKIKAEQAAIIHEFLFKSLQKTSLKSTLIYLLNQQSFLNQMKNMNALKIAKDLPIELQVEIPLVYKLLTEEEEQTKEMEDFDLISLELSSEDEAKKQILEKQAKLNNITSIIKSKVVDAPFKKLETAATVLGVIGLVLTIPVIFLSVWGGVSMTDGKDWDDEEFKAGKIEIGVDGALIGIYLLAWLGFLKKWVQKYNEIKADYQTCVDLVNNQIVYDLRELQQYFAASDPLHSEIENHISQLAVANNPKSIASILNNDVTKLFDKILTHLKQSQVDRRNIGFFAKKPSLHSKVTDDQHRKDSKDERQPLLGKLRYGSDENV